MVQIVYQVDAFTDVPFHGNPAGVCLLSAPVGESWMQALASEENLAETAFLLPCSDGFELRWFTPATEVKLCGHATLASAHILWETGVLAAGQQARFHTLSGLLTADQGEQGWIKLDFPAIVEQPVSPPADLLPALGVKANYVGRNEFDYLVEVDSEASVRNLKPEFSRLSKLTMRGVMVTARSSSPAFDFVSRFFAPGVAIDEDPVTGSAHCCLAPYWAAKLGKTKMTAYQASARGGVVKVQYCGERVILSGQAVTVFKSELINL